MLSVPLLCIGLFADPMLLCLFLPPLFPGDMDDDEFDEAGDEEDEEAECDGDDELDDGDDEGGDGDEDDGDDEEQGYEDDGLEDVADMP